MTVAAAAQRRIVAVTAPCSLALFVGAYESAGNAFYRHERTCAKCMAIRKDATVSAYTPRAHYMDAPLCPPR